MRITPLLGIALVATTAAVVRAMDPQIAQRAQAYVASGEVPGISVGIWRAGSAPEIFTAGVSDLSTGTPMNAANMHRIGSITKSFTVTRLLQLVEEGRVSLEDPISRYVPGLRNGDATLRQLADMTSGIFNYTEDTPFILDLLADPLRRLTDERLVAVANRHRPYFRPGAAWHYSNTNTVLLGMVIQQVTGNPLRAEITRHIIRPLRLSRTFYPEGVSLPAPFSHGYAMLDGEPVDFTRISPSGFAGSGAMISTLGDLARWGRALARGSLLGRRAQFERLRMVSTADGEGPFYNRYGLGVGRIGGWLGHTADVPGYQSLVMHNLVADETVVVLVNTSGSAHIPTDLFRAIIPQLPRAMPKTPTTLRLTGSRNRVVNSSTVTLRGRAFSAAGILLVEGSSPSIRSRIAQGTRTWRLEMPVAPGRSTITVRAADALGRTSRPARIVVSRE
jgi:CubicO group peptidase (beta-lactamase class C family)